MKERPINKKHLEWLGGDDRGMSSNVIFHVMADQPKELILGSWACYTPSDPSDFGRCYRLLKRFPEWEKDLKKVSDKYSLWKPIIDHWGKLKQLYEEESPSDACPKLYDLLQELNNRGKNIMKERPILMNEFSVKATLEDRKTQTRRVIKPQPSGVYGDLLGQKRWYSTAGDCESEIKCPYGKIGDRLWVRETFVIDDQDMIFFKADDTFKPIGLKWKPSIFMPRNASRIALEITDIRVERVQDISRKESAKEGVCIANESDRFKGYQTNVFPEENFLTLWNLINEKRGYGWEKNPWVWVIEFKRIEV